MNNKQRKKLKEAYEILSEIAGEEEDKLEGMYGTNLEYKKRFTDMEEQLERLQEIMLELDDFLYF